MFVWMYKYAMNAKYAGCKPLVLSTSILAPAIPTCIKDLWNGMGVGDRLATIPSIIDIPFIRVALDWSRFLSSIPVLPNLRRQASFCGQSLVVNHSCRTL